MSLTTRIPAKLSRPRMFGAIDRERLFALLDVQRERPLVWVTGPPGAGKTTLVTTYLERERSTTLWYRIDDGDVDAATFFSYLGQAAQALTRKRRLNLPLLGPEYLLDLPGFARRFFRSLFAALPTLGALVFDGYEAAPSSVLDQLLTIAAAELPQGMRILVTSREQPPGALAHLATQGRLSLLSWGDLRLSLSEALDIAGASRRAAAENTVALHTLSDGWAAGFLVLLGRSEGSGPLHTQPTGAVRENLFAFFLHEMFGRINEAERALLLHTALMSSFTAAQAAALCPNTEADHLLNGLYRQHYFVERTDEAQPVFRYHALFRDFLLAQGRALIAPHERTALLVQAAAQHQGAGQAEDAVTLLTEARAWEALVPLLCLLAPSWMREGRNATLDRAISALPHDVVNQAAWLLFWLGTARLPFAPVPARGLLETAFAQFETAGDTNGSMLACCGILNSYFLEWNDMHAVDRWGATFQSLAMRPGAFPTAEAEIQALAALSVLVFRASRHATVLQASCARALELMALTQEPVLRLVAANFAIWFYVFTGGWRSMRHLAQVVEQTLDLSALPPVHVLNWTVGRAARLGMVGDFEGARAAISQAQGLADTSGVRIFDAFIAGHGIYPALNSGDFTAAEASVACMRAALNPARTLDVSHCEWLECALAMAHGDWLLARRIARSGLDRTTTAGAEMAAAQFHIALAVTQIELGAYAAADAEVDWLLDYAAVSVQHVFRHSGLMLRAYAQVLAGAATEAHHTLRTALAMGNEEEYVLIVPYVPAKILQTLCATALHAGIEVAYVQSLIRRLHMAPPIDEPDTWPWRVKVYTLGHFALLRDGQPLPFSGKAQRKPIELLKALIGFGASAVPVDTLIHALWPEPYEGDSQKVFDITLHRLRKLMGEDAAITLTDRRVSLNPALVWLDTRSFEQRLVPLAASTWDCVQTEPSGHSPLEQAASGLLALYRGTFMADEPDSAWTLAMRDRLAAQFRRYLLQLGRHFEAGGRWPEAVRVYERGVELEPLAEELYRQLMVCLHQQGQHAQAVEVFRRCRHMLSVLLGVKPSRQTEDAYQAVIAAAHL